MKKVRISNYIFVIVIAVFLTGTSAFAQATYEKPLIFPYRGVLEINGEPYNGNIQMRFTLDDETNVSREAENYLWQDTMEVEVTQGQFYTLVGGGENPFTYLAFDENSELDYMDDLYIGVDIDNGNGFVELSNSQKIIPMLSAYMTTLGEDVRVNTLTVGGDDPQNTGRPLFRANQFTIDSVQWHGLVNLVAGAKINSDNIYEYLGTNGSSRILLNDGSIELFVGAPKDSGQNAGDEVAWTTGLTINSMGHVTATDAIITNAYITNTDINNATITGTATIASHLTLSGNMFAQHNLTVSENLTVSGNLTVNGNVNIGFAWYDDLIISSPTHDTGRTLYPAFSNCPPGLKAVSGACWCLQGELVISTPSEENGGWTCSCTGNHPSLMKVLCSKY